MILTYWIFVTPCCLFPFLIGHFSQWWILDPEDDLHCKGKVCSIFLCYMLWNGWDMWVIFGWYVDDRCGHYSNATYYEMDWMCGWCVSQISGVSKSQSLSAFARLITCLTNDSFMKKKNISFKMSSKMYIAFKLLPHRLDNCAKIILANSKTSKSSLANWLN